MERQFSAAPNLPPMNAPQQCIDFAIITHVNAAQNAASKLLQNQAGFEQLLTAGTEQGILYVYVAPADAWRTMIQLVESGNTGTTATELSAGNEDVKKLKSLKEDEGVTKLKALQGQCMEAQQAVCRAMPQSTVDRFRFISPIDFVEVLDRIHSRQSSNFKYWFEQTTYDSPKIVDVIIRLRTMANNLTVLRFDQDVLFSTEAQTDSLRAIESTVRAACLTANHKRSDACVQTWWLSGRYDHQSALCDPAGRNQFTSWARAFATRANPALLCTEELCNPAQFTEGGGWTPRDDILDQATDVNVMSQFFGVILPAGSECDGTAAESGRAIDSIAEQQEDEEGMRTPVVATVHCVPPTLDLETDIRELGCSFIGANPLRACISGSAFCTSPGLTLDLPPFSNFRLNVMWIDDHILIQHAREIKRPPNRNSKNWAASNALDSDMPCALGHPVKARGVPGNVAWYTLEHYMPTLLYGCVVDSWMLPKSQFHYLLKYKTRDMAQGEAPVVNSKGSINWFGLKRCSSVDDAAASPCLEELLKMQAGLNNGSLKRGDFAVAVNEVLRSGQRLDHEQVRTLRIKLRKQALKRVREVYWQWSHLVGPHNTPTFASLWATSSVASQPQLGPYCDSETPAARRLSVGSGMVSAEFHQRNSDVTCFAELPEMTASDLNPALWEKMEDLFDDAVQYLHYIVVWPQVVQAVRSIPDSELVLDPLWADR